MKGNKSIRGSTEWEKKFIDDFNRLCYRHHSWQVWQDFVHLSAWAISNAVDKRPDVWQAREDSYLATIKRYSKEEQNLICELLGITTLALEEDPAQDFLGKLYMQLDFGSGWHGQFFTPWHVAELMAKMLVGEDAKEKIASQDYISVCDTCCGAGCMLLAFAKVCKEDLGINYQKSVLFVAQDIDEVVAKMCYIQMSLLGCPGYVVVGNSLSEPVCGNAIDPQYEKQGNIWFTPLYFTNTWTLRRIRAWNHQNDEAIQIPKVEEPIEELSVESAVQMRRHPTQPQNTKKETAKKPFSLKEFFTVKRRERK